MNTDVILNNDWISVSLSAEGCLVSLINKTSGRNVVSPHALWRLVVSDADCREIELVGGGVSQIIQNSDTITVEFTDAHDEVGRRFEIGVTCSVVLENENLTWHCSVANREKGVVVREVHYPIISLRDPAPPMSLLATHLVSEKIEDVPRWVEEGFSAYRAPDQKYIRRGEAYPGASCSMNCFGLDWGDDGFYYGCHDPDFSVVRHVFELEKWKALNILMAHYPFTATATVWKSPPIVAVPYSGKWIRIAEKYRQWADSWYVPPQVPQHVATSAGWERIILHHQYGGYLFDYRELDELYGVAATAGIDTLFLFGWTAEGMDSGYPVYTPDPKMGGISALKDNIQAVRSRGGHVILYFNGQLIDAASAYFRSGEGRQVSVKREDGTEHREFYNFSDTGTFIQTFGNKTFTLACPSCRSWIEILKRHIDLAIELGVDSVFFDQIGFVSQLCCDPSHGHPVPFTGMMKAKRDLLREIYHYAKSKSPTMGVGIECTTDMMLPYTDFTHIWGSPELAWNTQWRDRGEFPKMRSAAYLFKAAFPEAIISNRNIRDDREVVFPVNIMLLLGSRSDVEVYRCRGSLRDTPIYREYLGLANAFRARHSALLFDGRFSANRFHSVDNPEVLTNSFLLGDDLAVLVMQSHKKELAVSVMAPGFVFRDYDSVRGDVSLCGTVVTLPRDSLALLRFTRKE